MSYAGLPRTEIADPGCQILQHDGGIRYDSMHIIFLKGTSMPKIAFIGAGSFVFTRNLVRDILSYPVLDGCDLHLMDIDMERLAYIKQAVDHIVQTGGYHARVTATQDRKEALQGSDAVVCTVLQGGVQVWRHDIEIPAKYGVDINVGDTRGPAGIFRALRTIPVMLEICRDIEEVCPKTILLNYTNPMAMLCKVMHVATNVNVVGLCHSVQGTAEMLARWIGVDLNDINYLCAGINHQAWFLKFQENGEDAYPRIREAVGRPEIYNEEPVRNEMFLHLDYYVTESSGHNSEYIPWFRKRPDLIERYCLHGTGWNPGEHAFLVKDYLSRDQSWRQEIEEELAKPVNLERGSEYAAGILNAIFGDGGHYQFNGNLLNHGSIDNLPTGSCVEIPITVSPSGLKPLRVGVLPAHLAALNSLNAACEDLAVEAAMEGNRRKIYHAVALDPLTSAVLSLAEIQTMVEEMFAANKKWLPQFLRKE
jgi:alpha-galactosidase